MRDMRKGILCLMLLGAGVLTGCSVPADYYERVSGVVREAIVSEANGDAAGVQHAISRIDEVGAFRGDSSLYVAGRELLMRLAEGHDGVSVDNLAEWRRFELAQRKFVKQYELIEVDW